MGYISIKVCVKLYSEMCCEATSGFTNDPHPPPPNPRPATQADRQQLCISELALIYSAARAEVLKAKCILIDFKLGFYALLRD